MSKYDDYCFYCNNRVNDGEDYFLSERGYLFHRDCYDTAREKGWKV